MSLVLSLMLCATPLSVGPSPRFPRGLQRMDLGAPVAGLKDWSNQRCSGCHKKAAAAWQHSGHATARTNHVFQAALRFDDPAWCVRCHAPLARRADRSVPGPDAPAEETSVTCSACHAGSQGVLSARPSPKSPHAIEVDPALTSGALCAACHQFGFSVRDAHGALKRLSQVQPQQDTFDEWQRWSLASGDTRTCLGCHMPEGDHSFGGSRRFAALKASLQVRETKGGLEVSTLQMGHRFPTGDIMRWLTLELATEPSFEAPYIAARWGRELGLRRWPDGDEYLGVTGDLRLPDSSGGAVKVELPEGQRWAAWRLVLHLVSLEQEEEGMLPPETSRVVINEGRFQESP